MLSSPEYGSKSCSFSDSSIWAGTTIGVEMPERLKSDQLTGMEKETDATPPTEAIMRPGLVLGALSLVGVGLAVFAAFWGSFESFAALLLLMPPAIVLSVLAIWRGYRGRYRIGFRLGVAGFVLSCGACFLLVAAFGYWIPIEFDNMGCFTLPAEDGSTSGC